MNLDNNQDKQSSCSVSGQLVDAFADLQILRYDIPQFDTLTVSEKIYCYYLSLAANEGRDILFDQNNRYNLAIRRTLEAIYVNYAGDKSSVDYLYLETYLKRVWFSNGIHHHYGEDKFIPGFSVSFFEEQLRGLPSHLLPLQEGQSLDQFIAMLTPVIFDPQVMPKKNNQRGDDLIVSSSENYYGEGITQKEVQAFYAAKQVAHDPEPVSHGMNSRLEKQNGQLVENFWKVGGLYTQAIEKIVFWLEKAKAYAQNPAQKTIIDKLVAFYQTGDLKTFDAYSIEWIKDAASRVDFVNGFIETYGDPLGIKASWEAIVNFKNEEATRRTEIISKNAQWFEDHSPVNPNFKKKQVKGVSAKVITIVQLAGDCYPATPIGINLPNAEWMRRDYGSKSVTIENIMEAYDCAGKHSGFAEEFVVSSTEIDLIKKYGFMTNVLHTDLHECLGHGSGRILDGVDPNGLGEYNSTIEEARADLYGLYFMADDKMIELNILPDREAYKAQYYEYMMNGLLTQLTRIEPGKQVEESHMKNRQLIARWVYQAGSAERVTELIKRDGKTFVVINDYQALRRLFGKLLAEIQRIKSEGDFAAAKAIVENFGVKVDPVLHAEILERYRKLNLKPYKGFVNPVLQPVFDQQQQITDIAVSYTEGYIEQMLRYSREFSSLPTYNF